MPSVTKSSTSHGRAGTAEKNAEKKKSNKKLESKGLKGESRELLGEEERAQRGIRSKDRKQLYRAMELKIDPKEEKKGKCELNRMKRLFRSPRQVISPRPGAAKNRFLRA